MKKLPVIIIGIGLLAVSIFAFWCKDPESSTALISEAISQVGENDQYTALIESLPKFSDYPAEVSSIPPKPIVNHKSSPLGMKYYTLTESWASQSKEYTMGGYYLMTRYGTGNPNVMVINGKTGKIFGVYGGVSFEAVASSSLVIFDPFFTGDANNPECFSPSGDYDQCYASNGGNPRYAVWTGEYFKTICEPVVRNWKVVSCGGTNGKDFKEVEGSQKVEWMGTVISKMTYGRLRIKLDQKQLGFSEFVAEPFDVVEDGGLRNSTLTQDIQVGDLVSIIGYLEPFDPINQDVPWVLIDGQAGVFNGLQEYSR